MADGHESRECIALAGVVGLRAKERLNQFGGIWDQRFRVLVNGSDSPDGILTHIGVAVFQTRARRGQERLDEFGLAKLAKESKSVATNVLVGVLEVVPDSVTAVLGQGWLSARRGRETDVRVGLTRPRSSPASTCHWHQVSDRSHSRSIAASSEACSLRA